MPVNGVGEKHMPHVEVWDCHEYIVEKWMAPAKTTFIEKSFHPNSFGEKISPVYKLRQQ